MAETWRVVLASGGVRGVEVRPYLAKGCVAEILAPGEPTRAELAAQLAAVTAERDALAALRPRDPHRTGHRCACCGREGAPGADDVCPWCSDGMATMRERDVARAQQAPLVACVDALRAAATAAGWRDADATGEHLVAWVRRGEREACAARLEREADEDDDVITPVLRKAARAVREGGE